MHSGLTAPRPVVALLNFDRDLGAGIDPEELAEARRRSLVRIIDVPGPRWDTSEMRDVTEPGWFGLELLSGVLMRRITVASRTACELFGVGDIFRPWDEDGEYDPLVITVEWLVLKPARLAVLDQRFALRMARWPSVQAKLMERITARARNLALIQAVTHLPRTHARLLLLFWLLAERWGKVGTDGVVVKLPLTHQVLAMLVGTHRPTVTIALKRLADSGYLLREANNCWLLTKKGVESLREPESLVLMDEVNAASSGLEERHPAAVD